MFICKRDFNTKTPSKDRSIHSKAFTIEKNCWHSLIFGIHLQFDIRVLDEKNTPIEITPVAKNKRLNLLSIKISVQSSSIELKRSVTIKFASDKILFPSAGKILGCLQKMLKTVWIQMVENRTNETLISSNIFIPL